MHWNSLDLQLLQTELKKLAERLEELSEHCPGSRCSAPVDLMLGRLWRCWAVLKNRVEACKASTSHKEAEWRDFMIRVQAFYLLVYLICIVYFPWWQIWPFLFWFVSFCFVFLHLFLNFIFTFIYLPPAC